MPRKPIVQDWRERKRLSQVAAAELLGCSRTAIIKWERGLHKTPRYIALAIKALDAGLTA